MSLIYSIENQIREISQKSNSLRILFSEEMPKITVLETAIKENSFLFAIENSPTIQKMNLDTLKRDYIEHVGYPRNIAYDWATGEYFWLNYILIYTLSYLY